MGAPSRGDRGVERLVVPAHARVVTVPLGQWTIFGLAISRPASKPRPTGMAGGRDGLVVQHVAVHAQPRDLARVLVQVAQAHPLRGRLA